MIGYLKNLILNNIAIFAKKKTKVEQKIDYKPQFVSTQLIEDFVTGKKLARNDPGWQKSGANTALEYEFWAFHICGTACLQMIISAIGINNNIFKILRELEKAGAYIPDKIKLNAQYRTRPSHVAGLFYKEFCEYIGDNYPLKAYITKPLTLPRIMWELSKNNFVIVSVHPSIRNDQIMQKNKSGGHLVVTTGYDGKSKQLTINNPSGFKPKTQKDHKISFANFSKVFSNKGIIIKKL